MITALVLWIPSEVWQTMKMMKMSDTCVNYDDSAGDSVGDVEDDEGEVDEIRWNNPDNGCRWYLQSSDSGGRVHCCPSWPSHSYLPICRWGESSHHFCWVGSHFKVSIGHVSEESFLLLKQHLSEHMSLPKWTTHPLHPPHPPISLFSFSCTVEGRGVTQRTVWVMREISGRDALEVGTLC